jgi:hypothetical protein
LCLSTQYQNRKAETLGKSYREHPSINPTPQEVN